MSDKMLAIVKEGATIETEIGGQKFVVKVMGFDDKLLYGKKMELMLRGLETADANLDQIIIDAANVREFVMEQIVEINDWDGTVESFLRNGIKNYDDLIAIAVGVLSAQNLTEDESKNSVSSSDGKPSLPPAGESSDTEATVG